MKQVIIDERFQQICETSDILKIYISNEYDEECLAFRIDISEFEPEQYETFKQMMEVLYDIQNSHLLTIIQADFSPPEDVEQFCYIYCEVPYMKTIGQYHQQNKCLESEFKANIADLVEIYEICKTYKLETHLSFDDMSIVPKKTDRPYPQLCITPYAFISAAIQKIMDETVYIHKPFAPLFEFYNKKIKELSLSDNKFFGMIEKKMGKGKKPFEEIINVLNNDRDAGREIESNEYIKAINKDAKLMSDIELKQFINDDYTKQINEMFVENNIKI